MAGKARRYAGYLNKAGWAAGF